MCSPRPDARSLSDDELGVRLDELELTIRTAEAERARCLTEVERRGLHTAEGQLSAAAWLARRHRIPRSVAEAQVRVARVLELMPRVADALARGEISTAAADALARAREAGPQEFARAEEAFVESARERSHHELRAELDRWRHRVDEASAARDEDERHARRRFTPVLAADGMLRTDGELDRENGQYLITALRAKVDVWARRGIEDERTPAQRRADALGGERPHIVVTMDLAALEARSGGLAMLEDTGPISAESARRLACDASITRVITDARSVPLEVGRTTRIVSPALRRALAIRDGGCAFPGCERPPGWSDAHHVRHWADGGETGLSNLVLLCRPHHRVVHRGFGVAIVDGLPVFRRPDGTPLEDRSPPLAVA